MNDSHRDMLIATKLYDHMFFNLVESICNSAKTCEAAEAQQTKGESIHYLRGKVDAYREVANRILKERALSRDSFFNDRKCNAVLEKIFRGLLIESLDRIIPDDKVRGNIVEFHKKQLLAQAFLTEMIESFNLGIRFEELRNKPEYNEMSEQELFGALLESHGFTKETMDFLDKKYELEGK